MNIEEFREYCLEKKGVTEELPFDETTLVYKVLGKMFALTDTEKDFSISLKCDPEKVIELREEYPDSVLPGYHMNKKHWNTIMIDGRVSDKLILTWVDESYSLVTAKFSMAMREKLNLL
ncbi:MAG: MmcQ/YjbR family DNA-binding protein [Bacteroidales bacterium]|jgi:predicted DNA-binding protein (MmcQ/YjbR family)|nr:MmcQ/YjbR family DNA-binding protein [Bacteroidales bacterium]